MKRFLGVGLSLCLLVIALAGQAWATPVPVACGDTSAATDQAAWSTAFGGATYPNMTGSTVVEINGMCLGDYNFKQSGVTFENHTGSNTLTLNQDGFDGLIEISGAHVHMDAITLRGPNLLGPGTTSTATNTSTFSEEGALALHDGAVVLLENSFVGPATVTGIIALRSSSISILNTTIAGNGTGSVTTAGNLTSGIWASDGSTIRLGNPTENALNAGGTAVTVEGNGTSVPGTSCQGFDILLTQSSSGDLFGAVIGGNNPANTVTATSGTQVVGENCGEIHLEADSSLKGRDVSIGHIGQFGPAVTAIGSAAVWFDENLSAASPGGSSVVEVADATTNCNSGGCSTGAILAGGASSVVLQDTGVAAPVPGISGQQPAVDISASSTLILAGGNTLCGGSASLVGSTYLSGLNCTPTSNAAQVLQADHSSSILHQQGQRFGYTDGVEKIFGGGSVQVQSSIDLGQGLISSNPSMSWTSGTGNSIQIQQNSSFRLSGGVSITGAVSLSQGSNGFLNLNNGGTAAQQTVSGGISCPFTTVPMSHVSAPTKVTPNVTMATSFSSATSPQCLPF